MYLRRVLANHDDPRRAARQPAAHCRGSLPDHLCPVAAVRGSKPNSWRRPLSNAALACARRSIMATAPAPIEACSPSRGAVASRVCGSLGGPHCGSIGAGGTGRGGHVEVLAHTGGARVLQTEESGEGSGREVERAPWPVRSSEGPAKAPRTWNTQRLAHDCAELASVADQVRARVPRAARAWRARGADALSAWQEGSGRPASVAPSPTKKTPLQARTEPHLVVHIQHLLGVLRHKEYVCRAGRHGEKQGGGPAVSAQRQAGGAGVAVCFSIRPGRSRRSGRRWRQARWWAAQATWRQWGRLMPAAGWGRPAT